MFTTKLLSRTITIVIVFVLALSGVSPAFAAAPSNDDFDFATVIGAVPFSDNIDTSEATSAFDDPTTCTNNGSVWYAFTPATNMTLEANTFGSNYDTVLSVYTGTRGSLIQVPGGCNDDYSGGQSRVVFSATSGTTYYFLLGACCGTGGSGGGNLTFSLGEHVLQPPVAGFSFYPSDASVFDSVQFYDGSYDPENIGIQSFSWDFGDGATAEDSYPTHQYVADGDYSVQHTVTTFDGRVGIASSQVIQVRTKDVAISKFSIPQTARVNQTKTINVEVLNKRYSDYVQVTLYKGLPGGGEQFIGTLTIYVPAKAKQATTFKFSYTFTSDDATIGKVTFRAEANIVNGRDALTADNTSIATTKVSR